MNNKPYAWINVNDEYKILFDDELPNCYPEAWIPLYTQPVKELTDEEIAEVFDNTFKVRDFEDAFLKFAKAILRKAQEK
jgi:hypothetical protein